MNIGMIPTYKQYCDILKHDNKPIVSVAKYCEIYGLDINLVKKEEKIKE